MKVCVVFYFPDIQDAGSVEADEAIASLTIDLKNAGIDCDSWYIEEAFGETK
jgi:hypothetical protein